MYSGAEDFGFGSAYSHRTARASQTSGTVFSETPLECKRIGESINEAKIVLNQESKGLSAKSHYPKKAGVIACLPAAQTVAAGFATLSDNANQRRGEE